MQSAVLGQAVPRMVRVANPIDGGQFVDNSQDANDLPLTHTNRRPCVKQNPSPVLPLCGVPRGVSLTVAGWLWNYDRKQSARASCSIREFCCYSIQPSTGAVRLLLRRC